MSLDRGFEFRPADARPDLCSPPDVAAFASLMSDLDGFLAVINIGWDQGRRPSDLAIGWVDAHRGDYPWTTYLAQADYIADVKRAYGYDMHNLDGRARNHLAWLTSLEQRYNLVLLDRVGVGSTSQHTDEHVCGLLMKRGANGLLTIVVSPGNLRSLPDTWAYVQERGSVFA